MWAFFIRREGCVIKGKNPTRKQKIFLSEHNLNPNNWKVLKRPPGIIVVINISSGKMKRLVYPHNYAPTLSKRHNA